MAREFVPYVLCVACYLLGGIPFGFLAGKMKGIDIRSIGSGNIGATNVLRTMGKGPGIAVLLLDTLKGLLPILAAKWFLPADETAIWWTVAVGLCAVLGHSYTPFLSFNGGKGVATSLGVVIGLNPWIAAISIVLFVGVVWISRYVSLGSMVGAVSTAALIWFWPGENLATRLFFTLVAVFVVYRHRTNIGRLRSGTENKFGAPKPPVSEDVPPVA